MRVMLERRVHVGGSDGCCSDGCCRAEEIDVSSFCIEYYAGMFQRDMMLAL